MNTGGHIIVAAGTLLVLSGCGAFRSEEVCVPTRSDSLGPFYVSGMPVLADLNRWGKQGEPLLVTGRVLDAGDQAMAVAGARIEIWQTDGEGDYHPSDDGAAADYDDRELDMRGTVLGDADGMFAYRTLIPAAYWPRPRHIHYRITAPGYQTLVTQHYLTDGESTSKSPCRSGPIDRSTGIARFDGPDIYLQKS